MESFGGWFNDALPPHRFSGIVTLCFKFGAERKSIKKAGDFWCHRLFYDDTGTA